MVQDLKGTRLVGALDAMRGGEHQRHAGRENRHREQYRRAPQCPQARAAPPDAFDIEVRCTDRIGRSPRKVPHSRSYGNAQPRLEPGGAETRTAPAATSGPPTRRGLTRYHSLSRAADRILDAKLAKDVLERTETGKAALEQIEADEGGKTTGSSCSRTAARLPPRAPARSARMRRRRYGRID